MRLRIASLVAGAACLLASLLPWQVSAESPPVNRCTFHSVSGVLEVEGEVVTLSQVAPGGPIEVRATADTKASPIACADADGAGLFPTGLNTEAVTIVKAYQAHIPQLGPGRSVAGEGGSPEIEVTLPEMPLAYVNGSAGDDTIAVGESGGKLGFNLDAGSEDASNADLDVFSPAPTFEVFYVEAGAGDDTIDAGSGAPGFEPEHSLMYDKLHLLGGPGDDHILSATGKVRSHSFKGGAIIQGGPGDDLLEGREGHDSIDGEPGDDVLLGNRGPDSLSGGKGADVMSGGPGSDLIAAKDKARDKTIACGPGKDFPAIADKIDPKAKSCKGLKPYDAF
jgi:hemolysin type calcium-binding protein